MRNVVRIVRIRVSIRSQENRGGPLEDILEVPDEDRIIRQEVRPESQM